MLSIDNALPYLIARQFVTAQAVISDDLTISSQARRNRNLRVSHSAGPGYLIKQPDDPSAGGQHTLRAEAAFYAFCQQSPLAAELTPFLPRMRDFDSEYTLVVLELLTDAQPLWSYVSQSEPGNLPRAVFGALGHALGITHRIFHLATPETQPVLPWLRRDPPWIMLAHKPGPELLASISPANYQTLQILQTQADLGVQLDGLRRLWQPQTLIHNDIKSDNILVLPATDPASPPTVRVVDWELVQVGDPAWDIAGVLQDMVLFWVGSMSQALPTPEVMAQTARYPLPTLQPAMRAFWRGYCAAAGLRDHAAGQLIGRAVRFSAARLIQTAYEMAQMAQTLPISAVLLLQISANLIADAAISQVQLYGLFQEVRVP